MAYPINPIEGQSYKSHTYISGVWRKKFPIRCSYTRSTPQIFTTQGDNKLVFNDKEYDDNFCVTVTTSTKFTAPYDDYYKVHFSVLSSNRIWTSGDSILARIYKNGILFCSGIYTMNDVSGSITSYRSSEISKTIYLKKVRI